jgi:hypothetical protein
MESPDLNSAPQNDAALETWLRQNAALPHLDDAGFTARVTAALPTKTAAMPAWSRPAFCAAGALAGVLIVLTKFMNNGHRLELSQQLDTAFEQLRNPWFGVAIAVAAVSILYAGARRPTSR